MIFSNNGLYGSSSGIILDPVHGAIQYFDHEKLIFDHFLFQRLRFILQTDVVNLVFPGSNHDRFQHSLGTMHMAGKMFATLIEFYLTEDREYGASAKLEEKHINAIQYINWILRTAALLHDVGTMPFSHQFEFFLERKKELKIRITDLWKDGLEILKNIYGKETYENVLVNTNSEYYIKHEDLSLRIAYQILTENYKDNEAKSIKNIFDVLFLMEKREEDISNYEYLWDKRVEEENLCFHIINFHSMFLGEAWEQKCEKGVEKQVVYNTLMLFRGIISGEFDADKMDYIVRDSFFIGCSYGFFNKEHLFNSIRIGYDAIKDTYNKRYTDIQYSLSFLDKGLGAFEDFVYARYQLYQEIYNHKTVTGFRILLHESFKEIYDDQQLIDKTVEYLKNCENYFRFNDDFVWEKIREYALNHPGSNCDKLIKRKKLRYITTIINKSKRSIDIFKNKLSQKSGKKYQHWKSDIKFSRIDGFYDTIKVWRRDDKKKKYKLDSLDDSTDFFHKFAHKSKIHIFELES